VKYKHFDPLSYAQESYRYYNIHLVDMDLVSMALLFSHNVVLYIQVYNYKL
jgi:hypothetical protein